ncbi:D-alanyl-D-alanine carboxypeptidase [Shigella flexneri]
MAYLRVTSGAIGADPTLKRQDIRNMVATSKKSGVNQIDGNVLIDTSDFRQPR